MIKNESLEREEADNKNLESVSEDLTKINDAHSQEKKSREESEAAIYEMLRDLVNRVKTEIDSEKRIRE
jgi:hypothetical protein